MNLLSQPDYRDADAQFAARLRACAPQGAPRVLEAGGGALSHITLPANSHITVLDMSAAQLERNDYAHEKVLGDLHTHEFPTESFDIIICWNVLEHLEDPARVLASFVRWTKPGGIVVIAAPNPRSLTGLITKYTPHSFHIWALKNLLGIKSAGQPGRGPFPTFMRDAMYPSELERSFVRQAWDVVHVRAYASIRLEHLNSERPLVGKAFSTTLAALKLASLGRWHPEHSDYHLIAQKPR